MSETVQLLRELRSMLFVLEPTQHVKDLIRRINEIEDKERNRDKSDTKIIFKEWLVAQNIYA